MVLFFSRPTTQRASAVGLLTGNEGPELPSAVNHLAHCHSSSIPWNSGEPDQAATLGLVAPARRPVASKWSSCNRRIMFESSPHVMVSNKRNCRMQAAHIHQWRGRSSTNSRGPFSIIFFSCAQPAWGMPAFRRFWMNLFSGSDPTFRITKVSRSKATRGKRDSLISVRVLVLLLSVWLAFFNAIVSKGPFPSATRSGRDIFVVFRTRSLKS